ncbi:hypothetical protein ACIRPK_23300 [Kitasatospora sp. NPDC101801]|uniref:hypothetical protein n=1 Tax=Kitasatospora sp. NPDC101801 TaxID=3364103 RepID=UPI00380A33CA
MSTGPDLTPLLAWLRAGRPTTERIDFPTGTALPDGRLDLCKQDLGPDGAALVTESLPPRGHLVLADTGLRGQEAHLLLDAARRAVTPTRYVLGKGVATTVRRRLDELAAAVPPPAVPGDVAAVVSVHRTAGPS